MDGSIILHLQLIAKLSAVVWEFSSAAQLEREIERSRGSLMGASAVFGPVSSGETVA